jgi:hypothetical protein
MPGEIHEGVVKLKSRGCDWFGVESRASKSHSQGVRAGMQLKEGGKEGKIIFRAASGHEASVGSLAESPSEPFGGFILVLAAR